jgi:tetratricopeptide (TPR) repeat protein
MPNNHDEGEIVKGLLEDAEAALARSATTKAAALYQGILALNPDHAVALRQLGAIALHQGDATAALQLFRDSVRCDPKDPDPYHGVGTALRVLGHVDDAILAMEAALTVDHTHAPALYDRALMLQQSGQLAAAADMYHRIAAIYPNHFEAILNRGVVLFKQDNLLPAERWFHEAARMNATDPRPLINLAMIYRVWGYLPQAIACLEHAVGLAPDRAETHWNLANALLVSGDFKRGFEEYEWRFRRSGTAERALMVPRWRGEPLNGKTILLSAEQGLGDAIHFVRFAAPLAAMGATVVLECYPGLEKLLSTATGVARVVKWGEVVRDADFTVPLLSVPHLLGTTVETVPAAVPYISVPDGAAAPAITGKELKVGLVWQGNPQHDSDQWRSISLELFAPLRQVPNVTWYSLQTGAGVEAQYKEPWAGGMIDLSPHLKNFAITAAVMAQLDLVISVDTASAHLAGALGRPVWVPIHRGNDWRWLHGRDDSPWYPTMRLFRQHAPRRWEPAIEQMATALAELTSS